ncbi:flagellar protein FliT [Cedecea colo]|uniref:Flagellar protein FliT n=1 Tax=Cedecea colo TaxID=2552946 RepID=A0ABX0VQ23_9ENTR|nr:flagellar protein FliT [Cedecea colo]NIY48675.1 flagellar protein FliT [Cedecea colo]
MTKALINDYESVYQLNLKLLEMARLGEWQRFIELAENYVIRLQQVINNHPEILTSGEQEAIRILIEKLIENEAEIIKKLKNRLGALKTDISSLNRGKKCSLAYSANFTTTLQ